MLTSLGLPELILVELAASRAGLLTQKLTYENGVLKMNYTGGDTCHKVYQRSTTVIFYCDRSTQAVSVLNAAGGRFALSPLPLSLQSESAFTSHKTSWLLCSHLDQSV